jgi:hypothetical protein
MLSKFACGRGYQKSEVWWKWESEWVSGKAKIESQVEGRPYNGCSKSEEDDPHAKAAGGTRKSRKPRPLKSKGAAPGFSPKLEAQAEGKKNPHP